MRMDGLCVSGLCNRAADTPLRLVACGWKVRIIAFRLCLRRSPPNPHLSS